MSTDEDISLRKYPRVSQLHGVAFQRLRGQVSNKAIELLKKEWQELLRATVADDDLGEYRISSILLFYTANICLGECHCSILLRYGIACKHYLKRVYTHNTSISKSFLHPRWWLRGPIVRFTGWQPSYSEDEIDYAGTASLAVSSYNAKDLLL
jgi:hypothetical protein